MLLSSGSHHETHIRLQVHVTSINPQVIDHHTAADATECFWIRHTFSSWGRYGITEISLPTQPQSRHARTILNEKGCIQCARHCGHVFHVMRMNDRGMLVVVFRNL